jgi:hypothetical protein
MSASEDVDLAPPHATDDAVSRSRVRIALSWTLTVLAFLLVWCALALPNQVSRFSPGVFLRIPAEGLAVIAVGLFLPVRARRIVATVTGVVFALLAFAKILDIGFYSALDRPFNPVTDWSYLGPAIGVLRDSIGPGRTIAVEIGAGLIVAAVLALFPLSILRLTRISARHRRGSARTVTALGVVWALGATFGVQVAAGVPIASGSTASLAYDQVHRVSAGLKDRQTFKAAISATDSFAITPGANLLTGLRGKDVIVVFVESYGQIAVQGSAFAPQVDAVLTAGTAQLAAAGFSSRSAFLTSPTFGGISWLAHSTLQSGLWIDNQQRYNQLVASNRLTLSDAFKRAGWRTVSDIPSNGATWREGTSFYHYDQLYNAYNVGYAGPRFSYASMPDQYTLAEFQRLELSKPQHTPVMAEIDLVSSHTPWTPLPHLVAWDQVGNGSVFDGMPAQGQTPTEVWRNSDQVKAAYGQSVEYSLNSLISFVGNVHDNNLVLVVLGDHQPATVVSGPNPTHDVPITIIAHDPNVMARISSWGWQDGMLPNPQATVWPMDAFRNRFLTAFGPHPSTRAAQH